MGNPALLALGDSGGDLASYTVQAWINTTQTSPAIIAGEQISGVNQGYGIGLGNFDPGCTNSSYDGTAAGFTLAGGGACFGLAVTPPSTTTVNDANWHQLVLVDNNGVLSLYVDGTFEGTAQFRGYASLFGSRFRCGRRFDQHRL
jgi:hypothetical protein